eukprot:1161441-Pelagomonas_calceolata.AAC.1
MQRVGGFLRGAVPTAVLQSTERDHPCRLLCRQVWAQTVSSSPADLALLGAECERRIGMGMISIAGPTNIQKDSVESHNSSTHEFAEVCKLPLCRFQLLSRPRVFYDHCSCLHST